MPKDTKEPCIGDIFQALSCIWLLSINRGPQKPVLPEDIVTIVDMRDYPKSYFVLEYIKGRKEVILLHFVHGLLCIDSEVLKMAQEKKWLKILD